MNPKIKFLIVPIILLLAVFIIGNLSLAQVDTGLGYLEESGLAKTDIRVVIANIIRIVMGFLGTLAVIIILIGGFKWMTAGGNEEKISEAKRLLLNGVIGLVIVLLSFSIASFILSRLQESLGVDREAPGGAGLGGGGVFYPNNLVVKSIAPQGPVAIRNVKVRITFNRDLEADSAEGNINVSRSDNNDKVAGEFKINSRTVEFIPASSCPEPNGNLKCFDVDTEYRVEVKSGIKSSDGKELRCGGGYPACEAVFTTGDLVDAAPPEGSITYPDDGEGVSVNDLILLEAQARDDSGVSLVEFYVDGKLVDSDGPRGATPIEFIAQGLWDTTGLGLLSNHTIQAKIFDINDHEIFTNSIRVTTRAEHCFNGIQDEAFGERGVDCGGQGDNYCGECDGGDCDRGDSDENTCLEPTNSQCASNFCDTGSCRCLTPPKIISVFSGDRNDVAGKYPNGAPGNYLTIAGEGFGAGSGRIVFLGGDTDGDGNKEGDNDDVIASLASCSQAWQSKEVVVEVPAGVVDGPLKLVSSNGLSDRTDDSRGAIISDFIVNNISRPGICQLNPRGGVSGVNFSVDGRGFGNEQGDGELYFGSQILRNIESWSADYISSAVPNLSVGGYRVVVKTENEFSNSVLFSISEGEGLNPRVDYLSPEKGSLGQYITLFGERFGGREGVVNFVQNDGSSVVADIDFPDACKGRWWRDSSVTVKVPRLELGSYQIILTTSQNRVSNAVDFSVTRDPVTPGICALEPGNGPVGIPVNIYGSGFSRQGAESQIDFWEKVKSPVTSWADGFISTQVPQGAKTGSVFVTGGEKVDGINLTSNRMPFTVASCLDEAGICLEGEKCCGDGSCRATCFDEIEQAVYGWYFNTGDVPQIPRVVEECGPDSLPSPSPGFKESGVCLNVLPGARFNIAIERSTLIKNNIILQECFVDEEEKEICNQTPEYFIELSASGNLEGVNDKVDRFEILLGAPDNILDFKANTKYRVFLTANIRGQSTEEKPGAYMVEDERRCGVGNAYCWEFTTGKGLCEVGSINMAPSPAAIVEQGPTGALDYKAVPRSKQNFCWALNPYLYNWKWETSEPSLAEATNDEKDGKVLPEQTVTATGAGETFDKSIQVIAETEKVTGKGDLYINFTPPMVIGRSPACDSGICGNTEISVTLNVPVNYVDGDLRLLSCVTESCLITEKVDTNITNEQGKKKLVLTHGGLTKNTWYLVQLRGGERGVKSLSGKNLANPNDGDYYSWKFQVRDSNEPCQIEQVRVNPKYTTLYFIGQVQPYSVSALGPLDNCNVRQPLNLRTKGNLDLYDWGWDSSDDGKVTLQSTKAPWNKSLLDVNPDLSGYCSADCLNKGTLSGVSSCGNMILEPGEDCDDGNTLAGDGCSPNCLNEGAVLPAICGDGYVGDPAAKYDYSQYIADLRNNRVRTDVNFYGEDCDNGKQCVNRVVCEEDSECRGFKDEEGNLDEACRPRGGDGCDERCLNEGAKFRPTDCGSGQIGIGEDCDDGNRRPGDGCSPECLNEGSVARASICGNFTPLNPEPGEDCDYGAGNNADAGCSSICLNEGTRAIACGNFKDKDYCEEHKYCDWDVDGGECKYNNVCGEIVIDESKPDIDKERDYKKGICLATAGCRWESDSCQKSICGDGAVDIGEDCDDGNRWSKDGCSSNCTLEGASLTYYNNASVCGDGQIIAVPGDKYNGKECDLGGPDTRPDPYQGAQALNSTSEPVIISAGANSVYCEGENCGQVEVACVCDSDSYCEGLGVSGADNLACNRLNHCCYVRPQITNVYPLTNTDIEEPNACPNGLLEVTFNEQIDTASLVDNIKLYRLNWDEKSFKSVPCSQETLSWYEKAKKWAENIFVKIGLAAGEQYWCPVSGALKSVVDENSGESRVRFTPDDILDVNATYYLTVKLDNEATGEIIEGARGLESGVGIQTVEKPLLGRVEFLKIKEGTGELIKYEDVNRQDFDKYFYTVLITKPDICKVEKAAISASKFSPGITAKDITDRFIFRYSGSAHFQYFYAEAQTSAGQVLQPFDGYYSWSWSWGVGDENLIAVTNSPGKCSNDDAKNCNKNADCGDNNYCQIVDRQTVTPKNKSGDTELIVRANIVDDKFSQPSTRGEVIEGLVNIENRICENLWSEAASGEYKWLEPSDFGNFSTWYCRDAGEDQRICDGGDKDGERCSVDSDCDGGGICVDAGDADSDDLADLEIVPAVSPKWCDISRLSCGNNSDCLPDEFPGDTCVDRYLKQYLLKTAGGGEAIGLRILGNPAHLSLPNWYKSQGLGGVPQSIADIDGYPAIRDGNTVYINFANVTKDCSEAGCFPNLIFTNILAISYSEGGGTAIQNIFNQIIRYLKFNENFYPHSPSLYSDLSLAEKKTKERQLRRDVIRWQDLTDVALLLEKYKEAGEADYPRIGAGTFLPGLTVSAWPSWNTVLGNELGQALPRDPLNSFGDVDFKCSNVTGMNLSDQTCWDGGENGGFVCPEDSHIYWYNYRAGAPYNLAAQFEYEYKAGTAQWYGDYRKGGISGNLWLDLSPVSPLDYQPVCDVSITRKGICGDGSKDINEVCDGPGYEGCVFGGYEGRKYYTCSSDCQVKTFYTDAGSTQIASDGDTPFCRPIGGCGDGIVTPPEECDDGLERNGQYGYCNTDCSGPSVLGFCGDGVKNSPYEVCDKGGVTVYGGLLSGDASKNNSCRWDCRAYGPYCGDGAVQYEYNEVCERGQIQLRVEGDSGPCGETPDGYQQYAEYTCLPNCGGWQETKSCSALGQECGNGVKEGNEQCDDGKNEEDKNNNGILDGDEDGCNNQCVLTSCGDKKIQNPNGYGGREDCDLGVLLNGVSCRDRLPYAGTLTPEQCSYCSVDCRSVTVRAPYCGDGIVDTQYGEECEGGDVSLVLCDDGRSVKQVGCSACKWADVGSGCFRPGEGESCRLKDGSDAQVCEEGLGCVNGKCVKCFEGGALKSECAALGGFVDLFGYCTADGQCRNYNNISQTISCNTKLNQCLFEQWGTQPPLGPDLRCADLAFPKWIPISGKQSGDKKHCAYLVNKSASCDFYSLKDSDNKEIIKIYLNKFIPFTNISEGNLENKAICVTSYFNYKDNVCKLGACGGSCGYSNKTDDDALGTKDYSNLPYYYNYCPLGEPSADRSTVPPEKCSYGNACNTQYNSIVGKFNCGATNVCGNDCYNTFVGQGCCGGITIYNTGMEVCNPDGAVGCRYTDDDHIGGTPVGTCYGKCCRQREVCSDGLADCVECENNNDCVLSQGPGYICVSNECEEAPECSTDDDCKNLNDPLPSPNAYCDNGSCKCTPNRPGECGFNDGCGMSWGLGACQKKSSYCEGNEAVQYTGSCNTLNNECSTQTINCPQGCENGECKGCDAKDHKGCFLGSIYWYDSCNQKGEIAEQCSPGLTYCDSNTLSCVCSWGTYNGSDQCGGTGSSMYRLIKDNTTGCNKKESCPTGQGYCTAVAGVALCKECLEDAHCSFTGRTKCVNYECKACVSGTTEACTIGYPPLDVGGQRTCQANGTWGSCQLPWP